MSKVANNIANIYHKAGVIAMCGDIGTVIFDYNEKPNEKWLDVVRKVSMKSDFSTSQLIELGKQIKAQRGGSAIAKMKHNGERGMVFTDGKLKLDERSGILNKFGADQPVFSAHWPWQKVPPN